MALLTGALSTALHAGSTAEQQIDQATARYWDQTLTREAATQHWQGMRFTYKNTLSDTLATLPACSQTPQVSADGEHNPLARQRLSVQCPDQPGWTVKVSSQATIRVSAVFANQAIERGRTIGAEQLKLQELDISKAPRGFFSRLEQVVGKGAKRRIRANQALDSSFLAMPLLVRRGEQVKIIANHEGIAAATMGEALENGEQGAVIRVRNPSSRKTIEAQVLDTGVVTSTFN